MNTHDIAEALADTARRLGVTTELCEILAGGMVKGATNSPAPKERREQWDGDGEEPESSGHTYEMENGRLLRFGRTESELIRRMRLKRLLKLKRDRQSEKSSEKS